jgi:hypothetical protein
MGLLRQLDGIQLEAMIHLEIADPEPLSGSKGGLYAGSPAFSSPTG